MERERVREKQVNVLGGWDQRLLSLAKTISIILGSVCVCDGAHARTHLPPLIPYTIWNEEQGNNKGVKVAVEEVGRVDRTHSGWVCLPMQAWESLPSSSCLEEIRMITKGERNIIPKDKCA